MHIIVKAEAQELQRARQWWQQLETQWKQAYNEAVFSRGPTLEPPQDDALMILLVRADTLRFAGPLAPQPNLSTRLTNLSGLVPLYHLRYLSISHTRIRSVAELRRHVQLEHLFLYDNELDSLAGLEGMQQLRVLYVQNNRLRDIDPLRQLTQLEHLYVSGNALQNLDGLSPGHSEQLKKFYLWPNDELPSSEVVRLQNECGIYCRYG